MARSTPPSSRRARSFSAIRSALGPIAIGAQRELREPRAGHQHSGIRLQHVLQAPAPIASSCNAAETDLRQSPIKDQRVQFIQILDVGIEGSGTGFQRRRHLAKAHSIKSIGRELTQRLLHDRIAAERLFHGTAAAALNRAGIERVPHSHRRMVVVTNGVRQDPWSIVRIADVSRHLTNPTTSFTIVFKWGKKEGSSRY